MPSLKTVRYVRKPVGLTGTAKAAIVASQIGNTHFPHYPVWEDFADVMINGNRAMGYILMHWVPGETGVSPF